MGEVLRNRPLLVFAIALILGLTFREHPWNLVFAFGILAVKPRLLAVLGGLALGVVLSPTLPKSGIEKPKFIESPARIQSVPRLYPDRIAYEVDLQGYRVTLTEPVTAQRSYGDKVFLTGVLRPLREGSEPFMLAKKIVGRFDPVRIQSLERGPPWYQWSAQMRSSFVAYTKQTLSEESSAVLDALCFNVESGLSPEFTNDLQSTGTIHIISASGLHVLIISIVLDFLLGFLPIPRSIRIGILGLLLAFYAAAAGLQPAIIRSVLMSMIVCSAYLWQREADLLCALALAAVAYLVWEPLGIYNIGFQISFLTVGSFALFGKIVDSTALTAVAAFREQISEATRTTLIAYVATLPILMFYFGSISLVAIPANAIIIPLVMVLVVAGMTGFAFWPILPWISNSLADFVLEPISNLLSTIVRGLGGLELANLPMWSFSGYWLVLIYCAALYLVKERVRPA